MKIDKNLRDIFEREQATDIYIFEGLELDPSGPLEDKNTQSHMSSHCNIRKMTQEERKKYGLEETELNE